MIQRYIQIGKRQVMLNRVMLMHNILKDNRIVFNIKGNSYRFVIKLNFVHQLAFVRFIGTHSDYDKIDSNNI